MKTYKIKLQSIEDLAFLLGQIQIMKGKAWFDAFDFLNTYKWARDAKFFEISQKKRKEANRLTEILKQNTI